MPKCNRCDAPIVWGRPPSKVEKWKAFDAEPIESGEWVLLPGTEPALALELADPNVALIVARDPAAIEGHRYRLHGPRCSMRGLRPIGESIAKAVPR